ncbi:hypothetical protein PS467_09470 [Streptomyces luomodiensis]|uniref:Uncharacterized protein n=1 Tax=Streptomyces luomodiensis TaxID=3026192 RepID=A0ABY9USM8_9ACTN|nr:hypothetical protein [Streptomyces sp. SCA4-21]WNE95552.1 hypothetical protein PS467_09470 [Streptomyces sp. SCA4-21]
MHQLADALAASDAILVDVVVPVAQMIIAFGVLVGLCGLRKNRKLRIMSFEDRFEQRYWELMERLSPKGARDGQRRRRVSPMDEAVARSYFRHCEAELNARAAGSITHRTWGVWKEGIQSHMRRWPFARVWDDIQAEGQAADQYPRLLAFTAANPEDDPWKRGWLVSWMCCLTGVNRR